MSLLLGGSGRLGSRRRPLRARRAAAAIPPGRGDTCAAAGEGGSGQAPGQARPSPEAAGPCPAPRCPPGWGGEKGRKSSGRRGGSTRRSGLRRAASVGVKARGTYGTSARLHPPPPLPRRPKWHLHDPALPFPGARPARVDTHTHTPPPPTRASRLQDGGRGCGRPAHRASHGGKKKLPYQRWRRAPPPYTLQARRGRPLPTSSAPRRVAGR